MNSIIDQTLETVVLQKLMVVHLLKIFTRFYEHRRFYIEPDESRYLFQIDGNIFLQSALDFPSGLSSTFSDQNFICVSHVPNASITLITRHVLYRYNQQ